MLKPSRATSDEPELVWVPFMMSQALGDAASLVWLSSLKSCSPQSHPPLGESDAPPSADGFGGTIQTTVRFAVLIL